MGSRLVGNIHIKSGYSRILQLYIVASVELKCCYLKLSNAKTLGCVLGYISFSENGGLLSYGVD